MKTILFTGLFLCFTILSFAQGYNQTAKFLNGNKMWMFGKKAGYNAITHTSYIVPLQSDEGCASVSSRTTGNILFYSDGRSCWNKNNAVMTQANANLLGNNLLGGTTAQGVCIVPFINDTNKYYLFSLQPQGGYSLNDSKGKLYYSVVDMTLSGGNGNVVAAQRNILLDSFLSESMIAIPGNNCDIWLMVHKIDTALFKAYHITSAGIDPNPVYSTTGTAISGVNTYVTYYGSQPYYRDNGAYMSGNMSVSPDRSKISITSLVSGAAGALFTYNGLVSGSMVCDFNPATGTVSNAILLDTTPCYGTVFSPDNSKLYISNLANGSIGLVQYDLSNYNAPAINASRPVLYQNYISVFGFKLYNDTVYVAYGGFSTSTPNIHRINNPNLSGTAANFQLNAITLATNTSCNAMLSNDVVYPMPPDTTSTVQLDTSLCEAAWSTMTLSANSGYASYLWDNGATSPTRTVNQSGIYWALCKDSCHSIVDSFYIHALPPDTAGVIALDTLICKSFNNLQLNASASYTDYVWNDGTTGNTKNISTWGDYMVLCKDSCNPHVDTFRIRGTDMSFNLGNDTSLCSQFILPLRADINNASYLWNDGATTQGHNVQSSGTYTVTVNKNGCMAKDSIKISYINLTQSLGRDTAFCLGSPFEWRLTANMPSGSMALWNNGETENTIAARDTGMYAVKVTQEHCSGSDTVHIGYVICECAYLMPNAFTPNSDGVNDLYKPEIQSGCATYRYVLNIYNRFGQKVFSGYKPESAWDGTFNGVKCDLGNYYYELSFEGGSQKISYYQKGDLTLVR